MYINSVLLENVKKFSYFEIKFVEPAGWHVFIGDNGSGKTTILQAIAMGLITLSDAKILNIKQKDFIGPQEEQFRLKIELALNPQYDILDDNKDGKHLHRTSVSTFIQQPRKGIALYSQFHENPSGCFSASYGPYRRFLGGNISIEELFKNSPRAKAHLTLFNEGGALSESIDWLKDLYTKQLENNIEAGQTLNAIKYFINTELGNSLLPYNSKIARVNSDGIFIKVGEKTEVNILQTSDGYRSILSLMLDLIRYMLEIFDMRIVFPNEKPETIDLSGVVLIDEIDAHLHPTWQSRIGDWFIKKFPKMQFIVTTHSPLICRACHKGSIWRLATPDSEEKNREVTGIEKDRLVYGNVLDAYGTGLFGHKTTRSEEGRILFKEFDELLEKSYEGEITDSESQRLAYLETIFPTRDNKNKKI